MWLDWRIAMVAAVLLAAGAAATRRPSPRAAPARAFALEAALVLSLYALWHWVGTITVTQSDGAVANADRIRGWEHAWHFPSEVAWQRAILGHPWLVQAANVFYAVVHVPALIAFLVWLFLRHRDRYPAIRNVIAFTTLGCLLIQLVPVAPPRLVANLGFVDTARVYGQSVYGSTGLSADQVAAMPSLHVAWAMIVGAGVVLASTSRWRWLVLAHPALTLVVVVVTANHWWLDGVVAVAVIALAEALRRTAASAWSRSRARPAQQWPNVSRSIDAAVSLSPEKSAFR